MTVCVCVCQAGWGDARRRGGGEQLPDVPEATAKERLWRVQVRGGK